MKYISYFLPFLALTVAIVLSSSVQTATIKAVKANGKSVGLDATKKKNADLSWSSVMRWGLEHGLHGLHGFDSENTGIPLLLRGA